MIAEGPKRPTESLWAGSADLDQFYEQINRTRLVDTEVAD